MNVSKKFRESSNLIDEQVRTKIDEKYRETVIDPLGKFSGYFNQVNDIIKRRQKKLLDYDSANSKAKKLIDNPSKDVDKLPKVSQLYIFIAGFLFFRLNVNDLRLERLMKL